ncbi:hypothetical protein Cob_v012877 [Colletotrichum orbiculare MAFF 240422]|uniref:DUF7726 domain-containing protein n=1 Tax=Colletotrichum orbiculare (strain 104-T / ATCC 96160 / CBS 514.97 / LARS 414 / MAFF 240422) TaxID=1213857 RepID=N4V3I6_COLOR|nr:hypothetical protein Cob_v012877 [Colletotrichum orbiculare MAFF 240422]
MPPKKATAAAASQPLAEADANRATAPNNDQAKPAPKPRKRKSDAVESADTPSEAPAPKKKATKAGGKPDPLPDLSDIHLDGDETMSVPVYDTCQDIRTKINAQLRKDGATKAGFLRAIVKAAYPPGSDAKMAASLLANFLAKKGHGGGNTSSVFYAAYVFFEKLRVRDGKPKSKKRLEMEEQWGSDGFARDHDMGPNARYWGRADESLHIDKYGKLQVVPRGGSAR